MQLTFVFFCPCATFPCEYITRSSSLSLCLPGYTISLSCIHIFTILPCPYSVLSQPRSLSVSEVHRLPIPIYQLVHCDLGKVDRITTQLMLLINHISHSRTTGVAAARQQANSPNLLRRTARSPAQSWRYNASSSRSLMCARLLLHSPLAPVGLTLVSDEEILSGEPQNPRVVSQQPADVLKL